MKHYINVRYLCHKAAEQSNVFENENRHSQAEVTEGAQVSARLGGSLGWSAASDCPRMLILEGQSHQG